MIPFQRLAALLMLAWLSGCASQPAVNRYTLPNAAAPAPVGAMAGAEAGRLLVVRPPRLARFLDVKGIVLQLDDITLNEARQHQWAEPLGRQLERGLRDRLAGRLPGTRVMLEGGEGGVEDTRYLRLEVNRFQGRDDGQAVVGGQWQLRDAEGALLELRPFQVETPLAADGYPALVRALGQGWDRVADEIARAIQRLH